MVDQDRLEQLWKDNGSDQQAEHAAGKKLLADAGQDRAGALEAFCENARASVVAPIESVGELCDLATGGHTADFLAKVAGKPRAADGGFAWAAAQIGSAVGMTPWMLLLHRGASAGVMAVTDTESLTAMQRIGVTTGSGLAYGLALTPTGSQDKDWLKHRWQNGLATGLSFGTLAGTTEGLGALGVSNRAISGVLSGVPAGLVDSSTRYATGQSKTFDPTKTMGTYAFLGGFFGVVSPYGGKAQETSTKANTVAGKSGFDIRPTDPVKAASVAALIETGTLTRTGLTLADLRPSRAVPEVASAPGGAGLTEVASTANKVGVTEATPATDKADVAMSEVIGQAKPGTYGYTGYFLSDAAIKQVQDGLKINGELVPMRWNPVNSFHVTEQFGLKSTPGEAWAGTAREQPAALKVVGQAIDNTGVEALVVTVDGKSLRGDGKYYHLTRSLADGRKANESMSVVEKALAVDKARTEGRLSDIKPEEAQRYSYVALKPEEQFTLNSEPRFRLTETTAAPEKVRNVKPEVPFESLAPRAQVIAALKQTPPDYLNRTIETRTPDHRAGSYFDMTPDQLKQELFKAKWEPYNPLDGEGKPIISGGARGYRATIPGGRLGLTPIDVVPESARLYLIDPKGIGKWSVSTVGASEPHTDQVTMIVGPEDGPGAKNIVWTFHPGEPVHPSALDTPALEALINEAGLTSKGLPESGIGRRIPITRAQLDNINNGLPAAAKMTLAKIESAENVTHPAAANPGKP